MSAQGVANPWANTRVHVVAPQRKKPRFGDRRTTKAHGLQVRVFRMARDHRGRVIGYDCTGGRQNYDWVSLAEAVKRGHGHLLTAEERAAIAQEGRAKHG